MRQLWPLPQLQLLVLLQPYLLVLLLLLQRPLPALPLRLPAPLLLPMQPTRPAAVAAARAALHSSM